MPIIPHGRKKRHKIEVDHPTPDGYELLGQRACPGCGQNSLHYRDKNRRDVVICSPQKKPDGDMTQGCGEVLVDPIVLEE